MLKVRESKLEKNHFFSKKRFQIRQFLTFLWIKIPTFLGSITNEIISKVWPPRVMIFRVVQHYIHRSDFLQQHEQFIEKIVLTEEESL